MEYLDISNIEKLSDIELINLYKNKNNMYAFYQLREKYLNLMKKVAYKFYYQFKDVIPIESGDIDTIIDMTLIEVCEKFSQNNYKIPLKNYLCVAARNLILEQTRFWSSKSRILLTNCISFDRNWKIYNMDLIDNENLTPSELLNKSNELKLKNEFFLEVLNNFNNKEIILEYISGVSRSEILKKFNISNAKFRGILNYFINVARKKWKFKFLKNNN